MKTQVRVDNELQLMDDHTWWTGPQSRGLVLMLVCRSRGVTSLSVGKVIERALIGEVKVFA